MLKLKGKERMGLRSDTSQPGLAEAVNFFRQGAGSSSECVGIHRITTIPT